MKKTIGLVLVIISTILILLTLQAKEVFGFFVFCELTMAISGIMFVFSLQNGNMKDLAKNLVLIFLNQNQHLDYTKWRNRKIKFKGSLPENKIFENIETDFLSHKIKIYGYRQSVSSFKDISFLVGEKSETILGKKYNQGSSIWGDVSCPYHISHLDISFVIVLHEQNTRRLIGYDLAKETASYDSHENSSYSKTGFIEIYWK